MISPSDARAASLQRTLLYGHVGVTGWGGGGGYKPGKQRAIIC